MNNILRWMVAAILMVVLAACGGGGGDGNSIPEDTSNPLDVSGTWEIVEQIDNSLCGGSGGTDSYSVVVSQNGRNISVNTADGTFSGAVSGDKLSWTGQYYDSADGAWITITGMSLMVSGNQLSGTANWEMRNTKTGPVICTGTTSVSGTRTAGGSKPDITVIDSVMPNDDLQIPFGNVTIGTNADKTVTIRNDGITSLVIGKIGSTNPLGSPFSLSLDTCSEKTIPPSASCTIAIRLSPTVASYVNDSLDIPTNDPDESQVTIFVSGSGTTVQVPNIHVTDSDIPNNDNQMAFEAVTIGSILDKSITITNTGSGLLMLGNIAGSNTLQQPFSILSDNCSGNSLPASGSCIVTIRFSPILTTTSSDTFDVPSNDPDEAVTIFSVSGTGVPQSVDVPAAPTNPVISNVTAGSAAFSWQDNSNNEDGFDVIHCTGLVSSTGNGLVSCSTGLSVIKQVNGNVTSTSITGLTANTQFTICVRAFNIAGHSGNTCAYFTTAAGQKTVTLQAISSNAVVYNSLDSTTANKVFHNSFPTVGIKLFSTTTGYPSSLKFAGLVKFNLSTLAGKTIDSATLDLVAYTPLGYDSYFPRDFHIGAVASAWDDTTVTWNVMSNFSYYTQSWLTFRYPMYPDQPYSIDMAESVQRWVSGVYANNGIAFLSTNYTTPELNINSTDAYEFYVPTLTVTYH